jgi:ABC-2 type transport system permease protein
MGELVRQTLRIEWKALLGWTISTVLLVIAVVAFFPAVKGNSALTSSFDSMPASVQAAFGLADLTSAAGYLQGQLFSTLAPLIFLSFAIGRGARAIAGEEERGTMDLLLSNPLRRSRVVLEKGGAIALQLIVLGAFLWLTLFVFGPIFDVHVAAGNTAAATACSVALGLLYGAIALWLSGMTGRRALSLGIASGLAGAGYLYTSIAPFVSSLSDNLALSPFQHAYGYNPVANGMQWGDFFTLVIAAAVFVAGAIVLFDRRDVHA